MGPSPSVPSFLPLLKCIDYKSLFRLSTRVRDTKQALSGVFPPFKYVCLCMSAYPSSRWIRMQSPAPTAVGRATAAAVHFRLFVSL